MKPTFAIVMAVFMLTGAPAFAERSLGPDEFTSVDELALAIAAYFPKVQGAVTAVEGDRLTVALGSKNGLKPGMVLTLWRDGKEILQRLVHGVALVLVVAVHPLRL